jgi:hypothetical protein
MLGILFHGTEIEANFCQNFAPQHFAEENTLSILFAGTGYFCFESLSQNAAAENSKMNSNSVPDKYLNQAKYVYTFLW